MHLIRTNRNEIHTIGVRCSLRKPSDSGAQLTCHGTALPPSKQSRRRDSVPADTMLWQKLSCNVSFLVNSNTCVILGFTRRDTRYIRSSARSNLDRLLDRHPFIDQIWVQKGAADSGSKAANHRIRGRPPALLPMERSGVSL
jgi:hypothetical protein